MNARQKRISFTPFSYENVAVRTGPLLSLYYIVLMTLFVLYFRKKLAFGAFWHTCFQSNCLIEPLHIITKLWK